MNEYPTKMAAVCMDVKKSDTELHYVISGDPRVMEIIFDLEEHLTEMMQTAFNHFLTVLNNNKEPEHHKVLAKDLQ